MTKYDSSDKTSNFGKKAHIKKGYYPGKLVKVELFANNDGTPRVGKYGQQLIFEFAVYKKDPETDAPVSPMTYKSEEGDKIDTPVLISKFAYHQYKRSAKGKQWVEGEFQTAITPNSAITKILKALGWKFSAEGVDPDEFIGNWVELNIDDYSQGEGDEAYTASTVKDINPYAGPEVKDVEDVKASEKPKKVAKQVKHEDVKEDNAEIKSLEEQIVKLKELNKNGFLTEDGLKQAVEQLETQIEELKKK